MALRTLAAALSNTTERPVEGLVSCARKQQHCWCDLAGSKEKISTVDECNQTRLMVANNIRGGNHINPTDTTTTCTNQLK